MNKPNLTDNETHLKLHADYIERVGDQLVEVSFTTGWRRIFFWRKRVFKTMRELMKAHIDPGTDMSIFDGIQRAEMTLWKTKY